MFFMGGMTMGYLQPPARAKKDEAVIGGADDTARQHPNHTDKAPAGENPMERTLIWARRILC